MFALDELRSRYRKLYAEQEQLRLEHNEQGRHFTNNKITEAEWKAYLKKDFNPASLAISIEISTIRNKLLDNTDFKLQSIISQKTKYPSKVDTDEKKLHYLLVLTRKLHSGDPPPGP